MNKEEQQQFDEHEIQMTLDEAQKDIDMALALDRLIANPDWHKVITQNLFQDEASRLVLLKADRSLQLDEHQKSIVAQMDMIGLFRQYCVGIKSQARMAEKAIQEARDYEAEVDAAEDEE